MVLPYRTVGHIEGSKQSGGIIMTAIVCTKYGPPEVLQLYAAYYDDPLEPETLLARLGLDEVRTTTWRR